ncbi:MAG: hypothetical protein ACRC8F_09160 [Cetobacterium sp.]
MKLDINNKCYTLKYNLLSRIKLSNKFETEQDMIELIQEKDFESLILFIRYCIQEHISDEEFLNSYPRAEETREAFYELALSLIKEAINPYEIELVNNESKEEQEEVENDFKGLLIEIMSKGYSQKQALNMTNWDITLIFKADYKKLEREVLHTNAIINIIIAVVGGKEKFDLLGRTESIENLEAKYPVASQALDFFYSLSD